MEESSGAVTLAHYSVHNWEADLRLQTLRAIGFGGLKHRLDTGFQAECVHCKACQLFILS